MLPLLSLASAENLLADGSGHGGGSTAGGWVSVPRLSVSVKIWKEEMFQIPVLVGVKLAGLL